ncbi:methionine aminopeptidase, type I [Caldalkalibacillus thermarum TA2.A1]|uniref:Methionine aminopeptidase n=1 Tax=Caldalkalibacillus thermarum (strain TA2.A1) TaxID=986075 RepID=F5L5J2_CALTT|nr:type I methionyl aminopeptidase [Caldalkalibacillus thermarum]EGL83390.1 methionine aminopeptidase, type I [Caldalkalibacillus thermarum TA2.A1]QZT34537.1 type I methionyl aminopeptidase [Caldalkalibacillus thermarum TA2.A1]
MTIETERELQALLKVGRVVASALQEMLSHVRPGISTAELDAIGDQVLKQHGARSAPREQYNFPGATCISVNEEVAHGIPGTRVLQPGDKVNIDVSAQLDGYFADTGATVIVPPVSKQARRLCATAQRALKKALQNATAGQSLSEIGRVVEEEAGRSGFTVVKNLCGHGIGRKLHEEPNHIFSFYNPFEQTRLEKGMVLAIEPFISTGDELVEEAGDGWTLVAPQGSLVAQFEHTIVVTEEEPIILTAWP